MTFKNLTKERLELIIDSIWGSNPAEINKFKIHDELIDLNSLQNPADLITIFEEWEVF